MGFHCRVMGGVHQYSKPLAWKEIGRRKAWRTTFSVPSLNREHLVAVVLAVAGGRRQCLRALARWHCHKGQRGLTFH